MVLGYQYNTCSKVQVWSLRWARHLMFYRVLSALSLLTCAPLVFAQRAIPDDNLAYPVLVNLTECASNVSSIQAPALF
jgi:hypothetical protein